MCSTNCDLFSTFKPTTNLLFFSRARYTLPNFPPPRGLPISKSFSVHLFAIFGLTVVGLLLTGATVVDEEVEEAEEEVGAEPASVLKNKAQQISVSAHLGSHYLKSID